MVVVGGHMSFWCRCMAWLASKVFLYNLLDEEPTKRIDLLFSNTRVNPSDNECLGLRIISNLHYIGNIGLCYLIEKFVVKRSRGLFSTQMKCYVNSEATHCVTW